MAAGPLTLAAEPGSARLLGPNQPATDLFTYGGALTGPVLRASAGGELALTFRNGLPEATTLCWGGLPVPNALLGVPDVAGTAIVPGQTAEIRFPTPTAGTFLFSPFDPSQMGRGLAGALVIEEAGPPATDRDVVLLVQDWRLAPDERVHLTVNGAPAPRLPVRAGERVRLRFVNATRGLFLPIRLAGGTSWIIAIDGRPAEPFAPAEGRLLMAPGGRVDLLVDVPGQPGAEQPIVVETPDGDVPLATLASGDEPPLRPAPLAPPAPLPGGDGPVALANAARVALEFGEPIATMFGRDPLLTVTRNRTVVLALTNRSEHAASVRLYGHAARLLDSLDDGWKPWWHDCVGVAPGRTVRLAFVAAAPGRWPIVVRRGGDDAPLALGWFETAAK
ncbi:multicopper oxidase family protein [Ancylobacter terrae]|uniref:multicopper oxidase family protein n=1 Tax=Ancylobacter sp. sgz301288 TaxID=3342077 RepID=UPI00385E75F2